MRTTMNLFDIYDYVEKLEKYIYKLEGRIRKLEVAQARLRYKK